MVVENLVLSDTSLYQAVFLDRDGVINASVVRDGRPYPPDTLDALTILPGVAKTLEDFRHAGLKTIVVTNQPDVATGKQKREIVDAIHSLLLETLALDDIKACFCVEGPGCDCYKPKPKMLVDAAKEWKIDLSKSFMIGDRWRDIGAGQAAGCKTFFIDYGYAEQQPHNPDFVVKSIVEAGEIILNELVQ